MDYQSLFGFVLVVAATVIFVYYVWPMSNAPRCPEVHRLADGSIEVRTDTPVVFPEEHSFRKWWGASAFGACPLPTLENRTEDEGPYAMTPINKVDDYEFSRIFGFQRGNRMEVPEQNFNVMLNQRRFDWPDKPLSSDERSGKYAAMPRKAMDESLLTQKEHFTGLKEIVLSEPTAQEQVIEAVSRYGERRQRKRDERVEILDNEESCKVSREDKEVGQLVAAAYASEPDYEPVVTRIGPNNWEVTELKPRHRAEKADPADQRVVDPNRDDVDIQFQYRGQADINTAIDPYFPVGDMPYGSNERGKGKDKDSFYGPVPGMERMFGPTFDTTHWY